MRKMITGLLVIGLISTGCTTVKMQSDKKCDDVISKCDIALKKKQNVIDAQDKALSQCQKSLDKKESACEKAEDGLKRPIHNPFIMGAVGATVGLLLGNPLTIGVGFGLGLLFF